MPALVGLHKKDPRKELLDKIGSLDWITVRANQVLAAVYLSPKEKVLASGHTLYVPDETNDDDRFRGKVGLVVKMGPLAFTDDPEHGIRFLPEDRCKVGDWIVFRASDGWQMTITGKGSTHSTLCRVFVEGDIRAVIDRPDMVW